MVTFNILKLIYLTMCFSVFCYYVMAGLLNIFITKETTTLITISRYSFNIYIRILNDHLTFFDSLTFLLHTYTLHTTHILHTYTLYTYTLHINTRTTAQYCIICSSIKYNFPFPPFYYNNYINHRNTFNLLDMSGSAQDKLKRSAIGYNMYFVSYTISFKYMDPNYIKNGVS